MQFQTSCYEMQSKQKKYSDRNGGKSDKTRGKMENKAQRPFHPRPCVPILSHSVTPIHLLERELSQNSTADCHLSRISFSLSSFSRYHCAVYILERTKSASHPLALSTFSDLSLSKSQIPNPSSFISLFFLSYELLYFFG
jgi:hypothetical protein